MATLVLLCEARVKLNLQGKLTVCIMFTGSTSIVIFWLTRLIFNFYGKFEFTPDIWIQIYSSYFSFHSLLMEFIIIYYAFEM